MAFTGSLLACAVLCSMVCLRAAQPVPYAWACVKEPGSQANARSVCPDGTCNVQQANVGGSVLILSTSSMASDGRVGSNPQACCNEAKVTDKANAWSFCTRPEGCGQPGACTTYLASLSGTSLAASARNLVPAAGFGRHGGCAANGTWPFRTCSVKQVADVANPPVWGRGDEAEGWIGGVVPKGPTSIKGAPAGLTQATASACSRSKAPQACLACVQGMTAWRVGLRDCLACADHGRC